MGIVSPNFPGRQQLEAAAALQPHELQRFGVGIQGVWQLSSYTCLRAHAECGLRSSCAEQYVVSETKVGLMAACFSHAGFYGGSEAVMLPMHLSLCPPAQLSELRAVPSVRPHELCKLVQTELASY